MPAFYGYRPAAPRMPERKKEIVDVAVILADASPMLKRMGNQIQIIETLTGLGFQAKRARDAKTPSGSVGELAVNEYAITLTRSGGPRFVPLVFYEDPDMEKLPVAQLANVHMLNTTAFLTALAEAGVLPEGKQLIDEINALRKTPMRPVDEPARTKTIRSTWIRKASTDAH